MPHISEPFDILGGDIIVPLLPRESLTTMTQTALSHSQLGELPRRRMIAPKLLGIGAMIAACLLLFVAPTFQWQPSIGNTAYNDVTDDNSEMVDLVMLDTFERF